MQGSRTFPGGLSGIVQRHYLGFVAFEIALWLEVVKDRGHITFPVAPATDLSGIGFQDATIGSDEDSEHLALRHLFTPFGMSLDVGYNVVDMWSKV